MPPKDIEIGSLTMTNISTGETYDLGEVRNLTQEIEPSQNVEPIITTTGECTLEIDNAEINQEQLQKVYQSALADGRVFDGYMDVPVLEQKRKHKKRRINKKWLKRYGKVIRYRKIYATKITYKPEDYFTSGLHNFEVEFDEKSWKVLNDYSGGNTR